MKRLSLSAKRLKQLNTSISYILLAHFKTAKTPSQVAKELELPANRVHYHVKRLLEAGLLTVAEQQGRAKSYQTVTDHFRIHKQDWPYFETGSTETLRHVFKRLEKQFLKALERSSAEPDLTQDPEDNNYLLFDLKDTFAEASYGPQLNVLEVCLSKAQYQRYSEVLANILNEAKTKPQPGTVCTFAVIAFQGRTISNAS